MITIMITTVRKVWIEIARGTDLRNRNIRPQAQQETYIVLVTRLHTRAVVCMFGHLGGSMVHSLALFHSAGLQAGSARPFPSNRVP